MSWLSQLFRTAKPTLVIGVGAGKPTVEIVIQTTGGDVGLDPLAALRQGMADSIKAQWVKDGLDPGPQADGLSISGANGAGNFLKAQGLKFLGKGGT